MTTLITRREALRLLPACALVPLALAGCSPSAENNTPIIQHQPADQQVDLSRFLTTVDSEPDTIDFQCSTMRYTVAMNVFDRLVETEADQDGNITIAPSLAESWEVSDDGRDYTFHLRKGVTFSNGAALTSSDVLYSLTRLLTHPNSCNQDIAEPILGAVRLEKGEANKLEGFKTLSDYDFTITLEQPFEAFLACISMPGASIMSEEATREAGDRFGKDPEWTIGTGPFFMQEWKTGERILLATNKDCWSGAPNYEGVELLFLDDAAEVRTLFNDGTLDLLDLEDTGSFSEYFLHGDIYQDYLHQTQRVGISYAALNESLEPLDDVRVRKALQLALNRTAVLYAAYGDRGSLENGIYPRGLYGHNPELPEIPYDPDAARALLDEAGLADGFDLPITVKSNSSQSETTQVEIAKTMWEELGVRCSIQLVDESEFLRLRKAGQIACYFATWTADYDDPDNFIYTFFGSREKTTSRSLCYPREDIMERVRNARMILNSDERLKEYHELERIIVQEDAAWVPLYSRMNTYATSKRLQNFCSSWNGMAKDVLSKMSLA